MADPSESSSVPPNRRRSVRLPLRASVKVECRKGNMGLGPNITVSAVNMSQSGMRLVLKMDLPKGQEVEIIIQGQGQPVKRLAKVKWALPRQDGAFDVGLDFDGQLSFTEYQDFTQSQRMLR
jgi:hypothetical protein